MLIRTDHWLRGDDTPASEITPQHIFEQRHRFLAAAVVGATGAMLAPWVLYEVSVANPPFVKLPDKLNPAYMIVEKATPYDQVITCNNLYEFGIDRIGPARYAGTLCPYPWQVSVEGLVRTSRTYGLGDLMRSAPMEERVYRLCCVEDWSMMIPWVGFPLTELIKRVKPQGNAKYIQLTSLADKRQMLGISSPVLDRPHSEGLRLDEAMHPLTLLTFDLYGQVLPNQNGAPVYAVLLWKYGFKSAKSIVKVRFVDRQPPVSWNSAVVNEYDFHPNVNPTVDHPRWNQATEHHIGEDKGGFGSLFAPKHKTPMLNGYKQVALLCAGMDLRRNF